MEHFDWSNNRSIIEGRFRTRTPDGMWSDSDFTPWETWRGVFDIGDWMRTLEKGDSNPSQVSIDWEASRETFDTVEAVSYYDSRNRFNFQLRRRDVYGGLYENVDRLRDYARSIAESSNDRSQVIEEIIDGLGMILAHDRGERDKRTPDGHCRHGVYVGGCGIDWTCGACESGAE